MLRGQPATRPSTLPRFSGPAPPRRRALLLDARPGLTAARAARAGAGTLQVPIGRMMTWPRGPRPAAFAGPIPSGCWPSRPDSLPVHPSRPRSRAPPRLSLSRCFIPGPHRSGPAPRSESRRPAGDGGCCAAAVGGGTGTSSPAPPPPFFPHRNNKQSPASDASGFQPPAPAGSSLERRCSNGRANLAWRLGLATGESLDARTGRGD